MGWWSIREDQDAEALSPAYGLNYRLHQRKAEIVISYWNDRTLAGPNRGTPVRGWIGTGPGQRSEH